MKDEFVTNVLAKMMGVLSQEQCQELKTALYMELQEYELEKRCTEVLDLDTSYIHYLQLFLAEGNFTGIMIDHWTGKVYAATGSSYNENDIHFTPV